MLFYVSFYSIKWKSLSCFQTGDELVSKGTDADSLIAQENSNPGYQWQMVILIYTSQNSGSFQEQLHSLGSFLLMNNLPQCCK